jgi:hypothetical protein
MIKLRIDHAGALWIARGPNEDYKLQECPFNAGDKWCGDRCPLFKEPEVNDYADNRKRVTLTLCQDIVLFAYLDDFQDDRKHHEAIAAAAGHNACPNCEIVLKTTTLDTLKLCGTALCDNCLERINRNDDGSLEPGEPMI